MHIVSVNVGRPMLVAKGGRTYSTAFNRSAAPEPVELTPDGFVGDRVSDLRWHGGPDKAACIYPFDHYVFWQERLRRELVIPSFGENLTTQGLLEYEVCIGDTFQFGKALGEVTQPRQPCFKLANRHDEPRMIQWINERRWTGFYIRVIQPGLIGKDDAITLQQRPHPRMSVARAMEIMLDRQSPPALVQELLDIPALSVAWRTELEERFRDGSQEFHE